MKEHKIFDPNSDELTIIIDHRENESGLPSKLRESQVFEIVEQQLDIGDVQIGELVIERKSVKDLERSLEDGRLMSQAVIMRRVCSKRLYIVEGDVASISPWLRTAISNAINSISIRLQTPVVFTTDLNHTAKVILRSAMWQYRLGGTAAAVRYRKPTEDDQFRRMYVLLGFPKLGPERARALLSHFGSLRAIFSASEKELQQVQGIGRFLAQSIVHLIASPDSSSHRHPPTSTRQM